MPPAPARFSTTSGCPKFIFGISMRMMRSGGPPGGEGTTTRIGLFGQGCACAVIPINKPNARMSAFIVCSVCRPDALPGQRVLALHRAQDDAVGGDKLVAPHYYFGVSRIDVALAIVRHRAGLLVDRIGAEIRGI